MRELALIGIPKSGGKRQPKIAKTHEDIKNKSEIRARPKRAIENHVGKANESPEKSQKGAVSVPG